jgi:hypothetical protein
MAHFTPGGGVEYRVRLWGPLVSKTTEITIDLNDPRLEGYAPNISGFKEWVQMREVPIIKELSTR